MELVGKFSLIGSHQDKEGLANKGTLDLTRDENNIGNSTLS